MSVNFGSKKVAFGPDDIVPVVNGGTGAATVAGSGTAGKVLASGASATAAAPTWRALVAADVPTLNQNTTGSAATLGTARTIQTNLASTASASFNGSADITPGVTGTLPVANGGTGATTLTGILKGNGTGAFSAATNGTDFLSGPQAIPANADLNTYQTPGLYYCGANATVATFTNSPTANALSLLVEKHAGVKQTVTEYLASAGAKTWWRNYYSSTWGPWVLNVDENHGKATTAGASDTATKLATARTIQTNLASTSAVSFDGSANITPGVTGILLIANGGTGAATVAGDGTKGKVLISGASATAAAPSFRVLAAADVPTLNQNTTGSAATLTTGRTIALTGDVTGTSAAFNGSANVSFAATLANSGVTAGTYPKVTVNAKGIVTAGAALAAGDVPTLNQNTTGSAAKLTTARTIQVNLAATTSASFDGSANVTPGVTGALAKANGGTGTTTGVTAVMNGSWYEERLASNFYRWTQRLTVTTAIATAWGGLYWNGAALNIPEVTGGTITAASVTAVANNSTANQLIWAAMFNLAQYGLITSNVTAGSQAWVVTIVAYGTKP